MCNFLSPYPRVSRGVCRLSFGARWETQQLDGVPIRPVAMCARALRLRHPRSPQRAMRWDRTGSRGGVPWKKALGSRLLQDRHGLVVTGVDMA